MKVYADIEQGTPEWDALRAGKATASVFSDLLAKGEGKSRAKVLRKVVSERLTGLPSESFSNAHTDRGQQQEPMARLVYEALTDNLVERVGFIQHDDLLAGCSPDGIVGLRRGVEIKSVIPAVQVETIMRGGFPPEHKAQIQGGMWLTGFDSWDFCSYSPKMPEHLRMYIFTVRRDEAYIQQLEIEVRRFLADVDGALEAVNEMPGIRAMHNLIARAA